MCLCSAYSVNAHDAAEIESLIEINTMIRNVPPLNKLLSKHITTQLYYQNALVGIRYTTDLSIVRIAGDISGIGTHLYW